jgi:hypothetical protein
MGMFIPNVWGLIAIVIMLLATRAFGHDQDEVKREGTMRLIRIATIAVDKGGS